MVNHGALACVQNRRDHRSRPGPHEPVRAGGRLPYLPVRGEGRDGGAHVGRRSWWVCWLPYGRVRRVRRVRHRAGRVTAGW